MKQLTYRKVSFLGMVLLTASTVVAALMPANHKNAKAANGVLALGETADTHTCIPADSNVNCHNTNSDGPWTISTSSGVFASTTSEAGNTTTGDAA